MIERRVMDKFCKFKIFPGGKGEPRLIDRWYRFRIVVQELPIFIRAEDASAFAAVRMMLDLDIAIVWGLLA